MVVRRWSSEDIRTMAKRYDELLRLATYPVAVKLFGELKELEEEKDEKGRPVRFIEAGKRLTVCQFLSQARYLGRVFAGTKESLSMCMPGAWAMGFMELAEEFADGYVRAYFAEEEIARKTVASVPHFEVGTHVAMLASPFERMPVDPDVVIFFGNTAQVMKCFYGYNYNKGGRLELSTCGLAGCADMVVPPMHTGKPNIIFGCNGFRILAWPSDNEAAFAIPAALLEDVLEGLEFNHRGMLRYPITWQHLDWEPPEGTVLRNLMDGKGFYPAELRHPERKA